MSKGFITPDKSGGKFTSEKRDGSDKCSPRYSPVSAEASEEKLSRAEILALIRQLREEKEAVLARAEEDKRGREAAEAEVRDAKARAEEDRRRREAAEAQAEEDRRGREAALARAEVTAASLEREQKIHSDASRARIYAEDKLWVRSDSDAGGFFAASEDEEELHDRWNDVVKVVLDSSFPSVSAPERTEYHPVVSSVMRSFLSFFRLKYGHEVRTGQLQRIPDGAAFCMLDSDFGNLWKTTKAIIEIKRSAEGGSGCEVRYGESPKQFSNSASGQIISYCCKNARCVSTAIADARTSSEPVRSLGILTDLRRIEFFVGMKADSPDVTFRSSGALLLFPDDLTAAMDPTDGFVELFRCFKGAENLCSSIAPEERVIVAGTEFVVRRRLGTGGFSDFYEIMWEDGEVAGVKHISFCGGRLSTSDLTRWELHFLHRLDGLRGVPKLLVNEDSFDLIARESVIPIRPVCSKTVGQWVGEYIDPRERIAASLFIGNELIRITRAAHDRGVIHCDIRDGNVMVKLNDSVGDMSGGSAHGGGGGGGGEGEHWTQFSHVKVVLVDWGVAQERDDSEVIGPLGAIETWPLELLEKMELQGSDDDGGVAMQVAGRDSVASARWIPTCRSDFAAVGSLMVKMIYGVVPWIKPLSSRPATHYKEFWDKVHSDFPLKKLLDYDGMEELVFAPEEVDLVFDHLSRHNVESMRLGTIGEEEEEEG